MHLDSEYVSTSMTVSIWQQAQQQRVVDYDVAVVGAGIVGCSVAYWLQQRNPSLRVALIDAFDVGHGASGRNAGFVLLGTHHDYLSAIRVYGHRTAARLWKFTEENRRLLADVAGPHVGWAEEGSLTVAGDTEEDERLQQSLPYLRAAGIPVVYLDPADTARRIHAQGLEGSLYLTLGAVVDPVQLLQFLATESRADVLAYHRVRGLQAAEQGGTRIHTSRRQIRAQQVVLAVGAHLPRLVPRLRPFVRPVRAQMLATRSAPERGLPVPVYSHRGFYYTRQLADGRVLAGGGRHRHRDTEVGYEDATTPAVQADIERYLHTHFPWTTGLEVEHRWAGIMGFSPDHRPVVGTVPEHSNCLFATGCTGHGMGFGFHLGRLLADTVCSPHPPPGYDLFSAARFKEPAPA